MKGFDKQMSIPKGDSAMWKGGGADLACKLTLDATEFILEILSPSDVFQFLCSGMIGENRLTVDIGCLLTSSGQLT
jgi:hypothetical protein